MKFEGDLLGPLAVAVLIDGERLADLMIRFNVGVKTLDMFAVQEIDEAFFLDEIG